MHIELLGAIVMKSKGRERKEKKDILLLALDWKILVGTLPQQY